MFYDDIIIKGITATRKYTCILTALTRSYLDAKIKVCFSFQTDENQQFSQKQKK